MSRRRVQNPKSSTRRKIDGRLKLALSHYRFLGISLGGSKTERTHLVVLEYYPAYNKLFVVRFYQKIKNLDHISSDFQLYEILSKHEKPFKLVGVDVPLSLPKCMRCQLKCPGYEKCKESEIRWMWKFFKRRKLDNKNQRLFSPYTERCIENYLIDQIEKSFHLPQALGSNAAPLTVRALFLQRRLKKVKFIETHPLLSISRMDQLLSMSWDKIKLYRNLIEGEKIRKEILHVLNERKFIFIYEQDLSIIAKDLSLFDALISAFTAYLKFRSLTELRPKGFPKEAAWIHFPVKNLDLSLSQRLKKKKS